MVTRALHRLTLSYLSVHVSPKPPTAAASISDPKQVSPVLPNLLTFPGVCPPPPKCLLLPLCLKLLRVQFKSYLLGKLFQSTLAKAPRHPAWLTGFYAPIFPVQHISSFKAGRAANSFSKYPTVREPGVSLLIHFRPRLVHKSLKASSSRYFVNRKTWNLNSL